MRTVTQNGKTATVPVYKGKVNFAAGFRKDRPVKTLREGALVIRERANDRTLLKVLGPVEGGRFQGCYVTPKGEPIKETPARSFEASRWPIFGARLSR